MIQFKSKDISNWKKRFRTNFINSLSGYKSANLIGTINQAQQTNLAIFTSVVHIGANPALMGMISRPDSVFRHTLENIKAKSYYTINSVQERFIAQAHQTAARYSTSEFDATGLTPEFIDNFPAPFVQEAALKIGLMVKEIIPIQINGTFLIIGEIQQINLPENMILEDGKLDLEAVQTVCTSGLDTYHKVQKISRFSYPKPDKALTTQ